jgi:hypothetical protein
MGCSSGMYPGSDMVPGLIDGFEEGDPFVTVAVHGMSLTVELITYGNACREKGELRWTISEGSRTVSLAAYDLMDSDLPCDDILRKFAHAVTIVVPEAGHWKLVVAGEDVSNNPVRLEYSIQIPS